MKFTAEYLRSRFAYDPETGDLAHKPKPPVDRHARAWNTKFSGRKAGSKTTTADGKSYINVGLNSSSTQAHRVIWKIMTGEDPIQVDHDDGNGLNNKWANLREADHSINAHNMRRSARNKSGVTGVKFYPKHGKWAVSICHKREQINLGWTGDLFEAICARKSAEVRLGFHKNHGSDRPL